MRLGSIQWLILDVDGVLTPGDVSYDENLLREMRFNTLDGAALKTWKEAGRRSALLSGRRSPIVDHRARELGIDEVRQGAEEKNGALRALLAKLEAPYETVCYVGDDLPDVGPIRQVGLGVAVANAPAAVKRVAGFVTRRRGGEGAVAEIVEYLLRKQGKWTPASRL